MLLSSLATSIYARITFVLGLCAWGIPTAVGFSQMTSCRLQSNYSSMVEPIIISSAASAAVMGESQSRLGFTSKSDLNTHLATPFEVQRDSI